MPRFENISILGISYIDPPNKVLSSEIQQHLRPTLERLRLSPTIIEDLTGINSRYEWSQGQGMDEIASLAAEKVIKEANINKNDIGILINSSVSKEFLEPSLAAMVHGNLGLPGNCQNYDVSNACLGFLNAIEIAGFMIERGEIEIGLIVNGENSRIILERTIEKLRRPDCSIQMFYENFATLTLGSTTVAMLLIKSELSPLSPKFKGGITKAETKYSKLCFGNFDGMTTNASALMAAGLEIAYDTYKEAIVKLGWDKLYPNELVIHQMGSTNTRKLVSALNLDKAKIYDLYPDYGNVGPASIPLVLKKIDEINRVNKNDLIGLMGIGSGINGSIMEVVW